MARNKAQYKTVAVDATEAGVITFREPLTVGSVTYKGLTWTGPYTPNVDGLSCTIRTPHSFSTAAAERGSSAGVFLHLSGQQVRGRHAGIHSLFAALPADG